MREDLVVPPSGQSLAVSAVLAHADTVPPPSAGDDEQRFAGNGGRRSRLRRRGGREDSDRENSE